MLQTDLDNLPRAIWWEHDATSGRAQLMLVDQTRLPLVGDVLACNTLEGVELAVKSLAVRGAPALGVTAAYACALWSVNEHPDDAGVDDYLAQLATVVEQISAWRPTAINLQWGARQVLDFARNNDKSLPALKAAVVTFAQELAAADEAANRALGALGATLLNSKSRVLTYCNTGSLATSFFGTALGVIFSAFNQGKIEHVWVSETRPANQGARLTTYELLCAGIPHALIADNTAASLLAKGLVDAVLVGADRICANGDSANKIGTLNLAVLAKHYGVPFYVCAPSTTIDMALASGEQVPIEQRDPRELAGFTATGTILPTDAQGTAALDALTAQGARELKFKEGHQLTLERKGGAYALDAWFRTTPPQAQIYNPAFDVTPAVLITAIVTEIDIYRPNAKGNYEFSEIF
jgi:methylthioribose-1-phosphate isomerase